MTQPQTQTQKQTQKSAPVASVPESVQARVLVASRRKCCLCYYLHNKGGVQKGQITHLRKERYKSRNHSDSSFENLVFLCLAHHDQFEFDSRNGNGHGQSNGSGFTSEEILIHRDRLYREMETRATRPKVSPVSVAPSISLNLIEQLPVPFRKAIRKTNGQFNFLLAPWRLRSSVHLHDDGSFLFAFKASNGSDGICRIERITIRDGRIVIICTQLPANPGTSITNEVEAIAFQVCAQLNIEPVKLVWIEHYPNVQGAAHRWSLVRFKNGPPRSMFTNPSWKVMKLQDWHPLCLRPRG